MEFELKYEELEPTFTKDERTEKVTKTEHGKLSLTFNGRKITSGLMLVHVEDPVAFKRLQYEALVSAVAGIKQQLDNKRDYFLGLE